MNQIESFKINHELLQPGIYISRVDNVGRNKVTTFDIRCKTPNRERGMSVEAMHTIEHLGATYFRNLEGFSENVIYFGPMGCQTGFYLVLGGSYPLYSKKHKEVISRIMDMFSFVNDFKGDEIPGATPKECGNYLSHSLDEARMVAANMLVMYYDLKMLHYEYPTEDESEEYMRHMNEEIHINIPLDIKSGIGNIHLEMLKGSDEGSLFSSSLTEEQKDKVLKSPMQSYIIDDVSVLDLNVERDAGTVEKTALF